MKKNRHKLVAITMAVLVTAAMAAVLCLPELSSYAAGDIKVQVSDIDGLGEDFAGFTFDLYKVGGYDGANFKLDPDYDDVNVLIPKEAEYNESKGESDPTWEEAWLSSAATLANHITHPAEGAEAAEPVATFEGIKSGNDITYHSDENALFLLIGRTARVGNQNYTPVPMFVRTLNGSETYTMGTVKVTVKPVVFEHALVKTWDNSEPEGLADSLRPDAIDVGIYYGSQLVDTVTLGGESGKWSYSWSSEETGTEYVYIDSDGNRKSFTPGEDDNEWAVKEIVDEDEMSSDAAKAAASKIHFYTPEYDLVSGTDSETFTITNKFSVKSLKLIKTIDGYDEDGQNVTFSFKITGMNDTGDVIYTNHAGVTMSATDGLSKETTINFIPKDVTKIEVTEEYSGNYELDGDISVEFDEATNMWTVTANNKHSDDHGPKGGVVNRYEDGKEPAQDPGQTPTEG